MIEGGGNDARDVLDLVLSGQDPTQRIADYVLGMVDMIGTLAGLGANHFLVWNITDLGLVPAVTAQGTAAAQGASSVVATMNLLLTQALAALPGSITDDLTLFDAYAGLNDIVANPAAYGLADASTACAADGACDASQAFFWDGIHPTTAGHQVMARLAVAAIPEPATGLLLGLAFLGLAATRRRAA